MIIIVIIIIFSSFQRKPALNITWPLSAFFGLHIRTMKIVFGGISLFIVGSKGHTAPKTAFLWVLAFSSCWYCYAVQIGAMVTSFPSTSRTFTSAWKTTSQVWKRSGITGSRLSMSWNRASCSMTYSTARQRSSQM